MPLLETLQKRFGKSGLFLLSDANDALDVVKVSTGIRTLDAMLGGGIPLGKIIEVSGPEGVGKTSLSLQIAKAFQIAFPDKSVVFVDVEGGNTREFIEDTYGIIGERMIYKRAKVTDSAETLLDFMEECACSPEVSIVILDSLASLVSAQDSDKSLSDGFRDNRPQLYARFLRRLTRRSVDSAPVLLLNQLRMKQNANPNEDPWYETGGMGLRYYPSLRIRLFHAGRVKDSQEIIQGFKVKALVHKARYSTPRRSCDWVVDYTVGIDTSRAILDTALIQGVLTKKGSWFYYGEQKWHGMEEVLTEMRTNESLLSEIEARLVFSDTEED